tara:strand:+ start:21252 stop:22067 length:816 start_codon:yes stop_codon:yes gene_type:complete
MKQIIGLFLIILFTKNISAQTINQSNVPAVVLNTFQLKSPNADDIKWKKSEGNYHIDYKVNNKSNKLKISNKGKILEYTKDLYISEIPKAVIETIRTKVAYFDMHDADLSEIDGKTTYTIRFKNDGKNSYFWIDQNGTLKKYRKELKDSEFPKSIINSIHKQFGKLDINRSKYVEENGNINYIIRGDINNREYVFWYNANSVLLKHSKDLDNDEIPTLIVNKIKSIYKNFEIRNATITIEGKNVWYRLIVNKSKERIHLTFAPNGKILKKK